MQEWSELQGPCDGSGQRCHISLQGLVSFSRVLCFLCVAVSPRGDGWARGHGRHLRLGSPTPPGVVFIQTSWKEGPAACVTPADFLTSVLQAPHP